MNRGETEVVLVVESDPGLRELYAYTLGRAYDARGAGSIADAFAVADPSIAVVVLDRRLPDGDGLGAVSDLRDATDGAFVVAVTDLDPGLDVVDAGLDDYRVKPVGPGRLREAVDALVNEPRRARALPRPLRVERLAKQRTEWCRRGRTRPV